MPESSRLLRLVAVPLMLVAGALVALQSQINGKLAGRLGDGARAGIGAAVVSFGTGLVILVVLTVLLPNLRASVVRFHGIVRGGQLRPAEIVGGLFGAFLVASQGITVGTIGVALFSVALTAGQAVSALVVDHYGIGPAGRQAVAPPRVVAAVFAVGAVVIATWSRLAADLSALVLLFALMAFVAGGGSSIQQAINGRVSQHVGPWMTTLNNFVVGTVALVVVFLCSLLAHGHLHPLPHAWWLYVGGPIGMCFIWLAALLVRVYGVLVLGLSMIAGQVIGAQIIQSISDHHAVPLSGIVAAGLTVVGVIVALALGKRRAVSP